VRASKLDLFKDYVKQRYDEAQLSAVRLIDEIRPMGYTGSLATLRRYLHTFRDQTQRHRKLTVRFETPPGRQAQADWAYCGKFPNAQGTLLSIYVFTLVLAFSRLLFVRFTTSMQMKHLLECHQEAFAFLGGCPQTILYDNMKQVKLGPGEWNEQFLDFARHYGFVPKTHRVRRPRTKGKVERVVDYVKDNFLAGRSFDGLDHLNACGLHWLVHTANVRIHGTTGEQPIVLFEQEKAALQSLAGVPVYRYVDPVQRIVNYESMVHFQGSRYSVPPDYAGQTVQVLAQGGQIAIRAGEVIIAEHRQAVQPGQSIVHKDHLAELWKLTLQRSPPPDQSPRWKMVFTDAVQQTPLSTFAEVCA
jgi:transposase